MTRVTRVRVATIAKAVSVTTAKSTRQFARSAVRSAKCPSSQRKAGPFTAMSASRSTANPAATAAVAAAVAAAVVATAVAVVATAADAGTTTRLVCSAS